MPPSLSHGSPRALCSLLQILIYHPAFIKYVFDSWLQGHGRYPSTGILSVIFSMHICDEVHPCVPSRDGHAEGAGGQGMSIPPGKLGSV